MMNRFFLILLPLALLFASCNNEEDGITTLSDDALIEAIVTDPAVTEVSYNQLPTTTQEAVELRHFETFVETVEHVSGRGYILQLGSGEVVYAKESGELLEFVGEFREGGAFSEHPHGRCFRRVRRFGRLLPPTELSEVITDYVTVNYPDDSIRAAKAFGDSTLVKISGGTVLLFGAADEFLNEFNILDHCTDRCGLVRPTTEEALTEYVTSNYPDLEVRRTCRRAFRIYVWLTDGEERTILVFNLAGEFLGERP